MAGIIGSLQGLEALKFLLGIGELLTGRMLVFDGLRMKFREVRYEHSSEVCRVCGTDADIVDVRANAKEYETSNQCKL
jgi:molybdopterin/thiamine biosynthesis adenylyltransferase